ncbi:MAG: terminase small subunit [Thalassovita sp.]
MALNEKQKRFAQEYITDLNATQAAIRAGYSEKTAYSAGQRLLKKVEVQSSIQKAQAKRSKRTEITQDRVLQELARIGFSDIRNAVAWGGKALEDKEEERGFPVELRPSGEIDEDTAAAISEVSLTGQGVKIKMHDKLNALDKLARHLGMLNGSGAKDAEAPALTINFNAKEPIGEVRVTRSKD